MTRAIICIFQGDFANAWHFHALSFLVLPILLILAVLLCLDILIPKQLFAYRFYKIFNNFLSKWYILHPLLIVAAIIWLTHIIYGL